ncbi:hypothetical protein TB1_001029 [Malus domestica]
MAPNGSRFTRASAGDILVPVGFRFRPTEEELVHYYLQMKLEGMDYIVSDVISEIDICNHEPRDLPGLSLVKSDDQEWYFFSTYKKRSKNQIVRATKEGFWKVTGERKQVKTEDKRSVIGEKRILTFKQGRVRNPQNTDWRDLVVCCVKKKSGENVDAANCHERESSTYNNNASDFENQQLLAPRMDIEELYSDRAVAQCDRPGSKKIGSTKYIQKDVLRREANRSAGGIPFMFLLLVGLIGIILGYILKKT